MAVSKKDLYRVFLKPREAYLLFLAKEETDTTLLPTPLTKEDKELYSFCVSFASDVADRADDIDAAKDWATKTDAAVADGEYSAKYYALQAAASAAAAAASAEAAAAGETDGESTGT